MRKRIEMTAALLCFGVLLGVGAGAEGSEASVAMVKSSGIEPETIEVVSIKEEPIPEAEALEETDVLTPEAEALEETDVLTPEAEALEEADVLTSEEIREETEKESVENAEYANLAIADVSGYVNVRTEPNTDSEIVGKIYDGAVAQILSVAGEAQDWFQITSGNVEGYIKAEFFIYGDAAAEVVEQYVTRYAKVNADRLNVREEPSTESSRIGYLDNGESVKLLENCGDWLRVQYTGQKEGYVAAEYVTISEEFVYAKTLEEERAEIAARKALEARRKAEEQTTPEILGRIEFPATSYASNEELRKAIVDYAMQYLGNKYVHGGSSLAKGTDCSGFTCFIYSDFGYSISRTPGGQYSSDGRSISAEEIQPGDIICYSSNGGKSCTHVALYIGDGQIIHEANSKKGVVIYEADYDTIIGIKNVID